MPQRKWLRHYASLFDTVELNATTYRLPKAEQVEAWCEAVPADFKYTVKLSRLITHRRGLDARVDTFIENYFARTRCFDPTKLAQVLVQFPPYLERDDEHLNAFLSKLPREFRYVIEFRHASWFAENVRSILTAHGAAFCIHDYPKLRVPEWVTSSEAAYLRLHGYTRLYAGSYPRRVLARYAKLVRALAERARTVYVYFNNDTKAAAPHDAIVLYELLAQATRRVPMRSRDR